MSRPVVIAIVVGVGIAGDLAAWLTLAVERLTPLTYLLLSGDLL
jgi:hypothetical protein